jgi:hypothetical protein
MWEVQSGRRDILGVRAEIISPVSYMIPIDWISNELLRTLKICPAVCSLKSASIPA